MSLGLFEVDRSQLYFLLKAMVKVNPKVKARSLLAFDFEARSLSYFVTSY